MKIYFGFGLKSLDSVEKFLLLLSRGGTELRSILTLPTTTTSEEAEGAEGVWEGTQPGQLTTTDPRDIPYPTAPCSAHTAGGRSKKSGTSGGVAFVCPTHHHMSHMR